MNEVDIDQDGVGQRAFVDIQGGGPAAPNGASANNSNIVMVDQSVDGNDAVVSIGGSSNRADVDQVGTDNNIGTVFGTDGIVIDGDNNRVTALQEGDGNASTFNVTGDRNEANVSLFSNSSPSASNGNTTAVDQDGDWSKADVRYRGNASEVNITQNSTAINSGQRNSARVEAGLTTPNSVFTNAFSGVVLGAPSANTVSDGNVVSITQDGIRNNAALLLQGDNNTTHTITQYGNSPNNFENSAVAATIGDGNTLTIDQGVMGAAVSGNAASSLIIGNTNTVDIDQLTNGNTASATINGMNNTSRIIQQ